MKAGSSPERRIMKARSRAFALSLLALALSGCGRSPRTQFFVLSPVRPAASQPHFAGAPVQVTAVHLPETLDRLERVTLQGPQLDVHEFQQWGAPLADMTRQVLSRDLAARLPAGMMVAPDAPATPQTRSLVVDVQQFAPDEQGRVVLEASWTLLPAQGGGQGSGTGQGSGSGQGSSGRQARGSSQGSGSGGLLSRLFGKAGAHSSGGVTSRAAAAAGEPVLTGRQRFEIAAGGSADAQVSAMNELLGQLADTLAAALRAAGS